MTNHYHLLIQTPHANLSRAMAHINGVYTQRYNRRHKSDGSLFRGRYKSIVVGEDSYLLELVRYIHKNPVQAGMVEDVIQYEWSSHKGYLSKARKWDWINKDFILNLLSPKKVLQPRLYRHFMQEAETEELKRFFSRKYVYPILGSDKFVEWIKDTFSTSKRDTEVPASKIFLPETKLIKKAVCGYYKVKEEDLYKIRRGIENEARDMTIYMIRMHCEKPLLEIGRDFNLKKHSSVGAVIERVKKGLRKDRKKKKRYEKLIKIISKRQTEI